MGPFHVIASITQSELELSCHGRLQALNGTDTALMVVAISI